MRQKKYLLIISDPATGKRQTRQIYGRKRAKDTAEAYRCYQLVIVKELKS